jgi:prophage maintenance system killer protein
MRHEKRRRPSCCISSSKDHPFADGNKRIGSFLFLLYLGQEGMGQRFSPQALTALALLVAESRPANKDLLIRLIVNLLMGSNL